MRNKRVLVISANPVDGTSFYRAWGPLSRMNNIELVSPTEITWPTLSTIDLVFFQRPGHQINVKQIAEIKKWNLPVWIDWDDNGFCLDKSNPVYDYFNTDEKQAVFREILRLADTVSVSTQHLKEQFLKEVPETKIVVIPNAVDDILFSLEPSYHERNKIIALRGGSSHGEDWGQYKDTILQLAKDNPDYTWAVMGFHPEWMNQIENIKIYEFSDIPTYFQNLMELRPAIAIVPLTDTVFNRSKSNIAFQEFTLAGAAVLASALPEFAQPGCGNFNNASELSFMVQNLIDRPQLTDVWYNEAIKNLPTLSDVNELRKDLIENLLSERKKLQPIKKELPVFTEKQFHDFELAYGLTPDMEGCQKLNQQTANWIIKTVDPKSALELGCGVGGVMLELLKQGVNVMGFELNPHSVQYFKDHYPVFRHQIFQADITKEPIEVDTPGDIVYSIECFEHITMPEEWWNQYLTDLSKKFKHFYFSSTPYHTMESFDHAWSHYNVRIMSRWKKLFESNGWELVSSPQVTTKWDMFFASKFLVN